MIIVEPKVEFATDTPLEISIGEQPTINVLAEGSLPERDIVEVKWYIDQNQLDHSGGSLVVTPERVGSLRIAAEVIDSAGLMARIETELEVKPTLARRFSRDYNVSLDTYSDEQNGLLLSLGMNSSARNALFYEFKRGDASNPDEQNYNYAERRYAFEFNDAEGTKWLLQIDSIQQDFRVVDNRLDFYNLLISPANAIIYKDGEIVESLDGLVTGEVLLKDSAIYQVEL